MKLSFILENKYWEPIFPEELFSYWKVHFQPVLGWKSTYVCQDLNTEKQ